MSLKADRNRSGFMGRISRWFRFSAQWFVVPPSGGLRSSQHRLKAELRAALELAAIELQRGAVLRQVADQLVGQPIGVAGLDLHADLHLRAGQRRQVLDYLLNHL